MNDADHSGDGGSMLELKIYHLPSLMKKIETKKL